MNDRVDLIVGGGPILTFDEMGRRMDNGLLAIDNGKVVALGERGDISSRYRADEVIDTGGDLIMPGLINAHTHAAMSILRGYADDLPLNQWLEDYIFPAEKKLMGDEMVYWGSLLSAAEMIRGGITTVSDGYFFEGAAIRAISDSGMRGMCAQGIVDFPTPQWPDPKEKFSVIREFMEEFSPGGRVTPALFVHAPYTCSPETYREAKELAERYGVRLFTHLAETRDEVKSVIKKYGRSPVRHMEHEGILGEDFVAVHSVWVDDEEIEMLATYGSSCVHCPGSNAKLASGTAPVPALLKAGVPVGLGTDGPASNNRQDIFSEMDFAAKEQKVVLKDPTILTAKIALAMALYMGAEAIGLEDKIGSLKPGMAADIIVIDLSLPHATPLFDYPSHLVYTARGSDVKTVIIDGRLIYDGKEILTFDESETRAKVGEIAGRLLR